MNEYVEKVIEEIEKKRLLEVGFDSCTLMWKQRMNRQLDEVIEIIRKLSPTDKGVEGVTK